ncbi:hypothetical protein LguiA_000802 [Lonicera macranthoides]
MCRWKPQQLVGDTATSLVSLREKLDDLSATDEVVVGKAIALLDRAIDEAEGDNIPLVIVRSVRDMLSGARMENRQEDRRKKRHDTSTIPSASTTPSTAAPRAPSTSTRPPVPATRAQVKKGKAPVKKKSKN